MMTKEEIQAEFPKLAVNLGDEVFKFFAPIASMWSKVMRMLHLSEEFTKLQQQEALKKSEEPVAMQDVPPSKDEASKVG